MNQFLNLEIQSMEQDHEKLLSGLESIILDTASILVDTHDMLKAKNSGLLSDLSVNAFAQKADKYLEKVAPEWGNNVSGLESDFKDNKEAGLESIMNSLRQGFATFIAFVRKMYENMTTLFADIYTKLTTSTKAILKEVKELKDAFNNNKDKDSYVISKDTAAHLYDKFYTALGIGKGHIKKDDFDSCLTVIEDMLLMTAEPKIPEVVKDTSGELSYVSIKKQTLSPYEAAGVKILISNIMQANNKAIMNDKFDFPTEALFSSEVRVLYVNGNSAQILLITDRGRLEVVTAKDNYEGSSVLNNSEFKMIRSNQLRFVSGAGHINHQLFNRSGDGIISGSYEFKDAKGVISLLDTIQKVCEKISNNSIRNENNKRIKELKKSSDEIMKNINEAFDALEDTKIMEDEKQTTRFQATMKEVTDIWRLYPRINNECMKGLYNAIKDSVSLVNKIKEDNKLEI